MERAPRPSSDFRSKASDGQPDVEWATKPSYSSACVALTFGVVSAPTPSCTSAFGSSAPAPMMPRGRPYLKLRATRPTPPPGREQPRAQRAAGVAGVVAAVEEKPDRARAVDAGGRLPDPGAAHA